MGFFLSLLRDRGKTRQALITAGKITVQVLPVLFFIFVLMGALQAFVPWETIAALLGARFGWGGARCEAFPGHVDRQRLPL